MENGNLNCIYLSQTIKIDEDDTPLSERIKVDDDDTPLSKRIQIDDDDTPLSERTHIDDDDSPLSKRTRIDHDDTSLSERIKVDDDDTPLSVRIKVDDDDTPLSVRIKVDDDDTPISKRIQIDDDDTPLSERTHIDDDDSLLSKITRIDHDDTSLSERIKVDDDDTPLSKRIQIDDDDTSLLERIHVYENDSVLTDNVHLSNLKQCAKASESSENACSICLETKYVKGTKTRELLVSSIQCKDATDLGTRFYHKSCYRNSIKKPTVPLVAYEEMENPAIIKIIRYIRTNVIANSKIIPLVTLSSMLTSHLVESNVGIDILESSKKHLRRKLEYEFKDELIFFKVDSKVYIRAQTISIESICFDYVKLKNCCDYLKSKVQSQDNAAIPSNDLKKNALLIRKDIKKIPIKEDWPPNPEDLNDNYLTVPESLLSFLQNLIGKQSEKSERLNRLIMSISQDILYAVTLGRLITPKHLLLPMAIKSLTGNVEVIKILNRLGHSTSYDTLERYDTALCLNKINYFEENEVPLPASIHPMVPTILAFDNIDRLEETESGADTSHRVNGIIIQPTSLDCKPQNKPNITYKRQRTIQPVDQILPPYISGGRIGPPAIVPDETFFSDSSIFKYAVERNFLWMLLRECDENNKINSWTGYNIRIRTNLEIKKDTVGYLPTINSPATDMATVQQILKDTMNMKLQLGLNNIVVVFDQALFAKVAEVVWKSQIKFEGIVLMMGNFHTICNLLSIIGKMFGDAGLRDLAVESGVIAEGSIGKVLEGKQYNRGIRLNKFMYEAFMRLAWNEFLKWLEVNHIVDFLELDDTVISLNSCFENLCHETQENVLNQESFKRLHDLFEEFLCVLRYNFGPLASFWMSYIDIVQILLDLLRADREGNWNLHLKSIRSMIPWCFAMDKMNYSRYLPIYYAKMTRLEHDSPEIYQHFKSGGFSVQIGHNNTFGKIAVDQTLEETVNKDTQTSGGTKGFSLQPAALSKYYLSHEYRSSALKQLRDFVSSNNVNYHPDLGPKRIKRDQLQVKSLMNLLTNNWTNPFEKHGDLLVNLSNGKAASPEVTENLTLAYSKGETCYEEFVERLKSGEGFFSPIKKLKLKTFGNEKKVKKISVGNSELLLKADRKLFATMVLIAQNRKLNMKEVLQYELGPLPWSLANGDGTMKKTSKAALAKYLESKQPQTSDMFNNTASAAVIDGMALLHKVNGDNRTFEDLSMSIFKSVLYTSTDSTRIDVVFDVYLPISIKNAERYNNRGADGFLYGEIKGSHKIKSWKRLLETSSTKMKLIEFLSDSWKKEIFRDKLMNKILYVTSGTKCFQITKNSSSCILDLESTQEEADTRLLLHAKHASIDYTRVFVISDDTDVFINCIGLQHKINSDIFVRRGNKNNLRNLDVKQLCNHLGGEVCKSLIGLHAFTGCDTVSAFSGQGKLKALKILLKNYRFQALFTYLGLDWELSPKLMPFIEEFTCLLYSNTTKLKKVNDLRYQIFVPKKGQVSSGQLPPCSDTLLQHTKRANYQSKIWRESLCNDPKVPDPSTSGWYMKENCVQILWTEGKPAPDIVLSLLHCDCSRSCRPESCECIKNSLKCTNACKKQNCSNFEEEDDDESYPQENDTDVESEELSDDELEW